MDLREEKDIIAGFYERDRQAALSALAGNEGKRAAFLQAMFTSEDLLDRVKTKVPEGAQLTTKICQLLTALGAPPKAYVISLNLALDGKSMELAKAVGSALENGEEALPSLVSCIPGKLSLFCGISSDEYFILRR